MNSNRKRIIVLAYATIEMDPPIFNLSRLLSARGYEVHAAGISVDGHQVRLQREPYVTIHRSRYESQPRLFGGAPSSLRYMIMTVMLSLRLRPSVFVAGNWNSLLVAAVSSGFRLRRIVYYQLEYLERDRESKGYRGLMKRLAFTLERWIGRRVAAVYSAEPNRSKLMREDYGFPEEPAAIYNCPVLADTRDLDSTLANRRASRFVYAGAITRSTQVLDLMQAVLQIGQPIGLDFYGSIQEEIKGEFLGLIARARERGHDIKFMGFVPYRELRGVLRNYDVGIVFYAKDRINQIYCSPGKLFEYLSCGLAVVASDNPGIEGIVKANNVGVCCDPQNHASLAKTIARLSGDQQFVMDCRRSALGAHRSHFNYEMQAAPLVASIEAVAS